MVILATWQSAPLASPMRSYLIDNPSKLHGPGPWTLLSSPADPPYLVAPLLFAPCPPPPRPPPQPTHSSWISFNCLLWMAIEYAICPRRKVFKHCDHQVKHVYCVFKEGAKFQQAFCCRLHKSERLRMCLRLGWTIILTRTTLPQFLLALWCSR